MRTAHHVDTIAQRLAFRSAIDVEVHEAEGRLFVKLIDWDKEHAAVLDLHTVSTGRMLDERPRQVVRLLWTHMLFFVHNVSMPIDDNPLADPKD
jgi:hypothetical protein